MYFYTNVIRFGNNLLVREIRNGERIKKRVRYSPTLFSLVQKPTQHKTLEGKYVTPITHETMKDAKEWIDQYQNQTDLIYGNTQYPYSYISDVHKETIDWDISKPDGTKRKLLDVEILSNLGWEPSHDLFSGIKNVYNEYCKRNTIEKMTDTSSSSTTPSPFQKMVTETVKKQIS